MPFDTVGENVAVTLAEPGKPQFAAQLADAKRDGFAWHLAAAAIGAKEGDFETEMGDLVNRDAADWWKKG